MQVKCINVDTYSSITKGQTYDVTGEGLTHYQIINNYGNRVGYPKDLFTPVAIKQSALSDTGARHEFVTGANREPSTNKGRYDLVSPIALKRLAIHYGNGAAKYADRNWEKGLPVSRCLESAERHLQQWKQLMAFGVKDGVPDEDHLAAAVWNLFAIMHYEVAHKTDGDVLDLVGYKEAKKDA